MATVSISGQTFTVYADHSGTGSMSEYAVGSLAHSSTYLGVGSETQKVAMVTASRILDSERWVGSKTVSNQALAWPRAGVTDADGVALGSSTIPSVIVRGFFELVLELIADPSLSRALSDPSSGVESINDGKVALKFWKPQNEGNRFPGLAQSLLAPYLSGVSASIGLGASERLGNDDTRWVAGTPAFDDADIYGLNEI